MTSTRLTIEDFKQEQPVSRKRVTRTRNNRYEWATSEHGCMEGNEKFMKWSMKENGYVYYIVNE